MRPTTTSLSAARSRNDFLKASGNPVGKSLVSDADAERIEELLTNKQVYSAGGRRSSRRTAQYARPRHVCPRSTASCADEVILDARARRPARLLAALATKAKTILWNGPLGQLRERVRRRYRGVARAIAASRAYSVLGGGDTVAVVEELKLDREFSFISTGGGAMLDFLATGSLPGIEVLEG